MSQKGGSPLLYYFHLLGKCFGFCFFRLQSPLLNPGQLYTSKHFGSRCCHLIGSVIYFDLLSTVYLISRPFQLVVRQQALPYLGDPLTDRRGEASPTNPHGQASVVASRGLFELSGISRPPAADFCRSRWPRGLSPGEQTKGSLVSSKH